MKKTTTSKRFLRTVFILAVAAALISCSAFFFGASAAESVSPSDLSASDLSPVENQIIRRVHIDAPTVITSNQKPIIRSKDTNLVRNALYNGSYRSELTVAEKQLYDGFYQQFVVNKKGPGTEFVVTFDPPFELPVTFDDVTSPGGTTDITNMMQLLSASYGAFFLDCPEAFWIRDFDGYYSFMMNQDGPETAKVTEITLYGFEAYPDAYSQCASFNSGLAAAVSEIKRTRASDSRYDTILRIHDYVCENSTYNYDIFNEDIDLYQIADAFTAAPLFTGKNTFVCEGYSKAVKLLCDRFGIPCTLVAGLGGGGNHMWNYVQMENGIWYCLDATWDDRDDLGEISHNYFLVGKNTPVDGDNPLYMDHLPDGNIMTMPLVRPIVYPRLAQDRYNILKLSEPWPVTDETDYALGASVTIHWDPVEYATKYHLLLSGIIPESGQEEKYEFDLTDTSYTFTPSLNGGWYYYCVTAIDETGVRESCNSESQKNFFVGMSGNLKIYTTQSQYYYRQGIRIDCCPLEHFATKYHLSITRNGQPYIDRDFDYEFDVYGCTFYEQYDSELDKNVWCFGFQFAPPVGDYTATFTAINDNGGYDTITSNTYSFSVVMPPITLDSYDESLYISIYDPHPTTTIHATKHSEIGELTWYSDDPEVATVVDGEITAVKSGQTLIYCKSVDGTYVSEPCSVFVSGFTISSEKNRVDFDRSYLMLGETDRLVLNTSEYDPVTWVSSKPSVVSVDSDGNITGLKYGTAEITASDSYGWTSNTIQVTVINPTENVTIVQPGSLYYRYKSYKLKAVLDKGAFDPVTWSVDSFDNGWIEDNGTLYLFKEGTIRVTATTISGLTTSVDLTVRSRAETVKWETVPPNMVISRELKRGIAPGETISLTLDMTDPENCNDIVSYSTSNRSIVSIDSVSSDYKTVTLTGLKKGTAVLTAKTGSGKKLAARITVVATPASEIRLNKADASIYVGTSLALKASALSKGNNDVVMWKSSDPAVATVDENGKVIAKSQGCTVITAYSSQNEAVFATTNVTVRTKATALQWLTVHPDMEIGSTVKFGITPYESLTLNMAIASPENSNDTITWKSSNSSVVSILSADGHSATVIGVKKGTASITARSGSGKTLTAQVTVVATPASQIILNKTTAAIYTGSTLALSARTLPKGNNDVVLWKSSDTSVATVDPNGKVKAIKQGTAVITAYSSQNSGVLESSSITVRTKATALRWLTGHPDMEIGNTVKFGITAGESLTLNMEIVSPENCNDTITWKSSSTAAVPIVSVDGCTATVMGIKKGTANITVRSGSGKILTAQVTVVATPASQITLNKTAAEMYEGTSLTLSARTLPKGNNDVVLWKSSDTSVATVDPNGKVKAIKHGTAVITAYSSQNNAVKETSNITVRSKATALKWLSGHPNMEVGNIVKFGISAGQTLTLDMDIAAPDDCNDTITWKSSNSSVVAITSVNGRSATVMGLRKGTVNITARSGSGKTLTAQVTVVTTSASKITLKEEYVDLFSFSDLARDKTQTLHASTLPRGNNDVVLWWSSDPSIVTVDPNGKLTAVSPGLATVTAYSATKGTVWKSIFVYVY